MPDQSGNITPSEAQLMGTSMQIASGMGTNYANRSLTREQNKIDRDRQDFWNYKQREWAEADWEKAAQYNSPAQQMARFKEAGLNPNLIYGKANEMPVMKTPSPSSERGSTPRIDNPMQNINVAQQYYAAKMMEKQFELMKEEIVGKRIENADKAIDSRRNSVDYLADVTKANASELGPRATGRVAEYYNKEIERNADLIDLQYSIDMNDVRKESDYEKLLAMQNKNAMSPIQTEYMKLKMQLYQEELKTRQYENRLNELGINKNDPFYFRIFESMLDKMTKDRMNPNK